MVDEIVKSAKAQLSERIASPLIGSFAISWCLWNYKFLVILFSYASVSHTFVLVDTIVFPSIWSLIFNGVLFPAATTFAYIFVYPYPAKYVYEFTRHRQKEINEVRQRIEDETLLTIEESRKIRAEVIQTEKAHQEIVDRLNGEISRLKLEMTNGQPEPPTVPPAVDESSKEAVTPTQLAVLKLLENAGGKMDENILIQFSNESKVKTEFDLHELVKLEMINSRTDMRTGKVTYEFLHEGRRILLDSAHYTG
ncbi:hypothetical protein [Limnohabitans sp.]|jgi:predicted DNA-binding transcriptional regulator|uniref:hypothetical protein n=1 Tax=Limnohabitans sp. TaxID=1907725 RepID=UPI00289D36FF|nr:hypothetical protein [Limnohabitans sp.]